MTAMTDIQMTGNSPITSYSLEWDLGAGYDFTPVTGFDTNNIVLSYTFNNLTKSTIYSFKYRVRNIFGWSPYSSIV